MRVSIMVKITEEIKIPEIKAKIEIKVENIKNLRYVAGLRILPDIKHINLSQVKLYTEEIFEDYCIFNTWDEDDKLYVYVNFRKYEYQAENEKYKHLLSDKKIIEHLIFVSLMDYAILNPVYRLGTIHLIYLSEQIALLRNKQLLYKEFVKELEEVKKKAEKVVYCKKIDNFLLDKCLKSFEIIYPYLEEAANIVTVLLM